MGNLQEPMLCHVIGKTIVQLGETSSLSLQDTFSAKVPAIFISIHMLPIARDKVSSGCENLGTHNIVGIMATSVAVTILR